MSRESNPKFQERLSNALIQKEASAGLIESSKVFVAEHLDSFAEWLQSFLQYLTLGAKDKTTAEDAELAAVVVEELTADAENDPVENAEQPDSSEESAPANADPLDNAEAPTKQAEESSTDNADAENAQADAE